MKHWQSSSCETAGEEAQIGELHPGGGAGGGCLEVFGQASAAAGPCQGALDDPSPRQQLEAFDARRTLDDFDRPGAAIGNGIEQLFAAVDAVGKDMAEAGLGLPHDV